MEILDIIKEAFVFPSNNLDKLAIYIVIMFVMSLLIAGGVFASVYAANSSAIFFIIAAILIILSIVVGLIITGYQVDLIKSGIDLDEKAPEFDWKNDIVTGIKMLIVNIVYMIIPTIIVGIVALITNVPGNILKMTQEISANSANITAAANSTSATSAIISSVSEPTLAAFGTSLAITGLIAVVLFIIFSFLLTMGESRLANTGSLGEALNVIEAAKDITRIGIGKVIAVVLLIVVIVAVIEAVLGFIYGKVPALSILSIIVTPYLAFFSQRAYGLLYSDIA